MPYLSARKAMAMSPEQRRKYTNRQALKGMKALDVIRRWMNDPDEFDLNEEERGMVSRMEFAKEKFHQMYQYNEVRELLMTEFNIAIDTASRVIRNMRSIYDSVEELPKSLKRQTAERMAMDAYKLAMVREDPDAAAKAIAVYIKASGIEKEDIEKFDIERIQSEKVFAEVLDPQIRSMLLSVLAKGGGVTDFSQIFEGLAADQDYTDYEQVPDSDEEPDPETDSEEN